MTIDETHFYKPPLNSNRLSYEEGAKDERNRIIKLLINHYQHRGLEGVRLDNPHNDNLDEAIELIKGETNE